MSAQNIEVVKMKDWLYNSKISFFKRHPEAEYVSGYLQLSNPHVVKALCTGFDVVSRSTYYINITSRRLLLDALNRKIFDEEEIFEIENGISDALIAANQYFDVRIAQGEKKIAAAGFDVSGIQRVCKNYQVKTVTNTVSQYFEILSKADYYLGLLGYLWITGELSDSPSEAMRVKLQAEHEVRTHLLSIVRYLNKCEAAMRTLVDKVRDQMKEENEKKLQARMNKQQAETKKKGKIQAKENAVA